MNDPHVEALSYHFVSLDERHDFTAATPWDGCLGSFECRLEAGQLEAVPRESLASEAAARSMLEPHLRSWELRAELEDGLRVRFCFAAARIMDRQPTAESVAVAVAAADAAAVVDAVSIVVGHSDYPTPSDRPLTVTPLVDELLAWIRGLRAGQPMLVVANLILTRLEFEYGGKGRAASELAVSMRVLSMIGRLAGRNDPTERRKVAEPINPLSEAEKQWIRAALPKIVRQVAEVTAGSLPTKLTMADLPPM